MKKETSAGILGPMSAPSKAASLESDPNRTIRYGVIGTGMMGCEHLRNINALPNALTVAVSDPEPQSLEWASTALEGQPEFHRHTDHLQLLERTDLDAVVIASPNFTHVDVTRDLFRLRPDLHVLIEKPLCTTSADCQDLIARRDARPAGSGIVWVGLEYRYMPPAARFLQEIQGGAIGTLKMLAIREHRFPFLVKVNNWNRFSHNTGGTLVEKCCHFFDLMNLAVGAKPVRVMASGGQDVNHLDEVYETPEGPKRSDILDNAFVIVDYENGVRCLLDLSMFAEGGANEQELVATGDRAKIEAFIPSGLVRIGHRGGPLRSNGAVTSAGIDEFNVAHDPRVKFDGFHHGASYLEHADFCETIRVGGEAKVTLEDGYWSVIVGEAAHRSIDQGRIVDIQSI
jgi:myo-inositol 2-dehydrogenase / D-chiro-inositol 1-dehydrogenase